MGIQTSLDAVAEASTIVDGMRLADDLAFEAGRDPGVRTLRVLSRAIQGTDQLVVIAAIHALAEINDGEAGRLLVQLLDDDRAFVREHAAWALGSGMPRPDAVARLLSLIVAGGFTGMLAQRSLERWSAAVPELLVVGVEAALLGVTGPSPRSRLVETLGLVRSPIATAPLLRIVVDAKEAESVRIAATAALGQRTAAPDLVETLESLTTEEGQLGGAALLALLDLDAAVMPVEVRHPGALTVAQLFLHADIDPALRSAGAGDNGGIATLLVRLGDALVAIDEGSVARVITLSRGSITDAASDLISLRGGDRGHVYGRIPLFAAPMPSAAAWPLRVTVRRGIRRLLRAVGGVDLLHLRMADVGSLAAADVARELGIPVVFTVAPDPHAVIESLDRAGRLTRETFGDVDIAEHFWFRTRLVQRLAANASHTVLFPRPRLDDDMRRLVGIDLTAHAERHSIVPEGVDLSTIDAAVADASEAAAGGAAGPAIEELRALVETLSPHRRGLPLIVSVGRLHRVKGMATLVEAWAGDLAEHANLLIIGGDLDSPSLDEREQLDLIEHIVPASARADSGLLLAGHRPNDVTARWMAAARFGLPGANAPRGIYACASIKEEFGIALLEAMACGLYVVAPDAGGPATYVQDGVTGRLTATWNVGALRAALGSALAEAGGEADELRADESRAMVRDRFTIQRMAATLDGVYRAVAAEEAELRKPVERAV